MTVGKKGTGTIRFRQLPIDRSFQGFSVEPTFADAEHVTEHLVQRFSAEDERVNRVVIVYNAFKSVLEQRVTTEQLLPIERAVVIEEDEETRTSTSSARGSRSSSPSPRTSSRPCCRTTSTPPSTARCWRAPPRSSRPAARRCATPPTTPATLIDELTLAMNRARQAAITQEILEVVAGADALE